MSRDGTEVVVLPDENTAAKMPGTAGTELSAGAAVPAGAVVPFRGTVPAGMAVPAEVMVPDGVTVPAEVRAAHQRYGRDYGQHEVSLYVHYPFCVHKCPYCDFASLPAGADPVRDRDYVGLLLREFEQKKQFLSGRLLVSFYMGGGTPSLADPEELGRLLEAVGPYLEHDAEISLEANPGTVDARKLKELKAVGFNRISIGVQSFNDQMLKRLGRIHNSSEAVAACRDAVAAGFDNYNIDLMHGLPKQDTKQALSDLRQALQLNPTHISWYELTLEEDTYFGAHPPKLPDEEVLLAIEQEGDELLCQSGFEHYEVSGYNLEGRYRCRHNQNYWLYGDYLGIGAAAHQKLSFTWAEARKLGFDLPDSDASAPGRLIITRAANSEDVAAYRNALLAIPELRLTASTAGTVAPTAATVASAAAALAQRAGAGGDSRVVAGQQEVAFEYMLNRLRLRSEYVSAAEYLMHTGLELSELHDKLSRLASLGLIEINDKNGSFVLKEQGNVMLNDVLYEFL